MCGHICDGTTGRAVYKYISYIKKIEKKKKNFINLFLIADGLAVSK